MPEDKIREFVSLIEQSIRDKTFVKVTLGNYHGNREHLQKLLIRLIETKKGLRLFVLYRFETRDTAKNFAIKDGLQLIWKQLREGFRSGHLFTIEADFQLDIGKRGRARLNRAKPTFDRLPDLTHDRQKQEKIDRNAHFLRALGITSESGKVFKSRQGKWKQINRFVTILDELCGETGFAPNERIDVLDMGSGKGYLTFSVYAHLRHGLNLDAHVTGIDANRRLVNLCNDIARASEFDQLEFQQGQIVDQDPGTIDVLIALHACDTATDDAIYRGISGGARLILVSPCCHREVRPQIVPPDHLRDVLSHGSLLEQHAEVLTDGLRSLFLAENGYRTKIIEYVSTEHTPKNQLIAGILIKDPQPGSGYRLQIEQIKDTYGIRNLRLENLLASESDK